MKHNSRLVKLEQRQRPAERRQRILIRWNSDDSITRQVIEDDAGDDGPDLVVLWGDEELAE